MLQTLSAAPIRALPRLAPRLEAWLLAERAQLVLFAPVLLGIGIAAWFLLPFAAQRLAAAAAALALAAAGWLGRGLVGHCAGVAGLLLLAGLGAAQLRSDQVAAPRLEGRRVADLTGTIEAVELRPGRDQVRLLIAPDGAALPPRIRIAVRGAGDPAWLPGARVALRAGLAPPAGPSFPGGYDFARRAWFAGVGATGFPLGPVRLLDAAPPPAGPAAWLARLRLRLNAMLREGVGGPPGAVAAALVTGDQGAIPLDTAQAMRDAGLAHLLSISGLHIAVVAGAAFALTRRTLALSPWLALHWPLKGIAAAAAAVAAVAYTVLAGAEVPTVRSCLATLIVLVGVMLGREAISLRLVAAGAFLILLVRPEALLGPSFQLSFAAVTGLVALYQSRLGRWLGTRAELDWPARAARAGLGLVVTGLLAEAMLAPAALYHFNRTGLFGAIANLAAIPLTSFVIMPLLAAALALAPLSLAAPAYWGLHAAVALLIAIAETVAAWPAAVVRLPVMPDAAYGLIVIGGLWLCLWQTRPRVLGFAAIAGGVVLALAARPPDLLVSADGRHAAIRLGEGRLAFLRDSSGAYVRDMWADATATPAAITFAALPPGGACGGGACLAARCSPDACLAEIRDGPARWRLLATLSRDHVPRARFQPDCAAADIAISERRLPSWCRPRWLKLDRAALGASGAVAIWLAEHRVETVAARLGDHPWLGAPETRERAAPVSPVPRVAAGRRGQG